MNDIEKIKRQGAVDTLKKQIDNVRFELSERLWDHVIKDGKYVRLGAVIKDGKRKLEELETLLAALIELEPGNR